MELRDYFPILRRNLAVVIVLALLGALGGLAYGATRPVTYSADAKVFVSARSATTVAQLSEAAAYITQAVASYADVATSALILDPVIDELGLDDSITSLKDRVTVTAGTDETVLDIQAEAGTPQEASDLANAVGRQLTSGVRTLTSGSTTGATPLELTLVDPAVVPQSPTGPGLPIFIAAGALIGLLLGFIVAVLRESLDSRLRSEREVTLAAEAPVLGSIPRVGRSRSRSNLVPGDLRPAQAEAIRSVRNALQFLRVDGGVKSFVVTSAVPGDGKTAVSINLAASLADNGERVLILDGDLRKPDVAKYLGLDGSIGLTDVLIGRVALDEALQAVGASSLSALPAGSTAPNPNELIQSSAMRQVMTELLERFDRVIIDSPPQLPVSDAGILARLTDGALIVVTAGRTSRSQLTTVVERLRRVDATVLGAVLNLARAKPEEGSYGVSGQLPAPIGSPVPDQLIAATGPIRLVPLRTDERIEPAQDVYFAQDVEHADPLESVEETPAAPETETEKDSETETDAQIESDDHRLDDAAPLDDTERTEDAPGAKA